MQKMHELSMTTQIVENVLEEAKRQRAKKILEVRLIIGKMTYLGIEQIQFSYKILSEDNMLKGSKLIIEEKDGVIECQNCNYRGIVPTNDDPIYHIPIPTLKCPNCGKEAKIVEGKECIIKGIRMLKKEEEL
jgi:hydrogenase nickel incorporation protein HypA/HybF